MGVYHLNSKSLNVSNWDHPKDDILVRCLRVTTVNHPIYKNGQWNWVIYTHSDFLFTISLEPNVVDPRYLKLWILLDQIFWAWNIKGFQHQVLKI